MDLVPRPSASIEKKNEEFMQEVMLGLSCRIAVDHLPPMHEFKPFLNPSVSLAPDLEIGVVCAQAAPGQYLCRVLVREKIGRKKMGRKRSKSPASDTGD